ncbi:MAG: ATP-binding cassette domain-containing protein [Acidimicrobiaceae bacterium]|nr:ATP-binding cassette domain-containing protein [Ilumatobacter sp.]MCB9382415.1 ATP-binding cassette domain-containing protein [Acidimicrobiaceae bacterium]MCO5328583.1 ATP-binding cassette domain-containing protein [Ilumatobacteraceae bacterium]
MGKVRDSAPAVLARANLRASPGLAVAYWALVVVRAVLPAVLTLGLGALVRAVQEGRSVTGALVAVGATFALVSVLGPIHTQVAALVGDRTSGHLQAELTRACSSPKGIAHLERPGLADELVAARDFDLGILGPPISVSMGFVAAGLVELLGGAAQAVALATVTWWGAILIGGAWASTHWLLRSSSFWINRDETNVKAEQRHADYAYRLAVEAAPAKEVRLFGIGGWVVDRFAARRRRLLDLQWESMRLKQRSLLTVFAVLAVVHVVVLVWLVRGALHGDRTLAELVVAAQALVGVTALGVGASFSWALDSAAAPVKAVWKLAARMADEGALAASPDPAADPAGLPEREIRFRDVAFTYPSGGEPVYERLNLTIPAGRSLAIVGRNGVGKTTLVKLLCRLYDPTSGAVEVDGADIRRFDVDQWRERVAVVFQDFVRLELSMRDNVVPASIGAGTDPAVDPVVQRALVVAGAEGLAELDRTLSKAYEGGTDLSGGQWQRVALARALAAVELGAGVIVLDEPTAQLDVRGEAEIFERLLDATRGRTTILISHRFSTVRHADCIVVIEHGEVVEQGTHEELMALDGRYRTMFDLQAARFALGLDAEESEDGEDVDMDHLDHLDHLDGAGQLDGADGIHGGEVDHG